MDGNSGEGRNQNGGQERIAQEFQTGATHDYGPDAGGQSGSPCTESIYDGRDRDAGTGLPPSADHHDDGLDGFQTIVDRLEQCPLRVVLRPFIRNIHEAYAAADLVVARSGAMTCAEILSRELPAVFIPYPHASGHQEMNARILEKAGSAVVITEKQLESEKLIETLDELLANPEKMKTMGEKAGGLARPDASAKIAEALLGLVA